MRWPLLCCATIGTVALCGAAPAPRVQATIYSTERCVPCRRYVEAVKREMPPDGWVVRDAGDKDASTAHVIVTKATNADGIEGFPTTIIRKDGKEVDRFSGQITPTQLAERINRQLK